MSGNPLNALLFLIRILFDFYAVVLIIRLMLAWVHADYYSPITQFTVKLTDVVVKPLKRVIPDIRRFELSTLLLLLVVQTLKFLFITLLSFGISNILGLFILAIANSLFLICQTLSLAIILQALISWINPASPIMGILNQLTAPLLRPFQRVIPPVGGIDLSPLPPLIILQLVIILLVNPLEGYGLGVAIGT